MPTVGYDEFLPYVQSYVPECPTVVVEQHLAEAAARFCKETYIWRVDIEEDTTIAGESLYDIDVPAGTVLEAILQFEVDGATINRVPDRYIEPNKSDTPAKPDACAIYHGTQVRLYPPPDKAYTFRGVAAVKPSLTSGGVERFIYETYGRAIAFGAIAQLTAIPDKSWTNPTLSYDAGRAFHRGVDDARIQEFKSVQMRVRPRPFA